MRKSIPSSEVTPWGVADSVTHYGPGIAFYTTPSHGGFKLEEEQLAKLERKHGAVKTFCGQRGWFEEDCDWAYVATAFPMLFTERELDCAGSTLEWLKSRKAVAA